MSTISKEVTKLLNAQIKMESQASVNYLAAAAWCNAKGYDNSADFFFIQADEERSHMLKIFHYLCDMGEIPATPAIDEARVEYSSLRDVFEMSLESEINVTNAINKCVNKCRKENDHRTESFLQWFVSEQIEEEFITRRAVELFDLMGEDKLAIFMIDERIPKITYNNVNGVSPTA
jgi:ferritin